MLKSILDWLKNFFGFGPVETVVIEKKVVVPNVNLLPEKSRLVGVAKQPTNYEPIYKLRQQERVRPNTRTETVTTTTVYDEVPFITTPIWEDEVIIEEEIVEEVNEPAVFVEESTVRYDAPSYAEPASSWPSGASTYDSGSSSYESAPSYSYSPPPPPPPAPSYSSYDSGSSSYSSSSSSDYSSSSSSYDSGSSSSYDSGSSGGGDW